MTPQELKLQLEMVWEGLGVIEACHKVKWFYRKDWHGRPIVTCGRGMKVAVIFNMPKPEKKK